MAHGRAGTIHGPLLAVCQWTVYAVEACPRQDCRRHAAFWLRRTEIPRISTLCEELASLRPRRSASALRGRPTSLSDDTVAQAPDSLYVPLYGPQLSLFFAPFARLTLRLGADGVASGERFDLRLLLSRGVEELSESSGTSLDGSDPGDCLSGIFSPAGVGTDFGFGAFVFHAGLVSRCSGTGRYSQDWRLGRSSSSLRLGLAAAVVFVFARDWKVVAGAVAAACIQLAAAWMLLRRRRSCALTSIR